MPSTEKISVGLKSHGIWIVNYYVKPCKTINSVRLCKPRLLKNSITKNVLIICPGRTGKIRTKLSRFGRPNVSDSNGCKVTESAKEHKVGILILNELRSMKTNGE
jgi:hypothetical protein